MRDFRLVLGLALFPAVSSAGFEYEIVRRDLPAVFAMSAEEEVQKRLPHGKESDPKFAGQRKELLRRILWRRSHGGMPRRIQLAAGPWGWQESIHHLISSGKTREERRVSDSRVVVGSRYQDPDSASIAFVSNRDACQIYLLAGYLAFGGRQPSTARGGRESVYEWNAKIDPPRRLTLRWAPRAAQLVSAKVEVSRVPGKWTKVQEWIVRKPSEVTGLLFLDADLQEQEGGHARTTSYRFVGKTPDPKTPIDAFSMIRKGDAVTDSATVTGDIARYRWSGRREAPEVIPAKTEEVETRELMLWMKACIVLLTIAMGGLAGIAGWRAWMRKRINEESPTV
ncbi:hypothetical protein EON81_11295 [bacterium]|nr:MAG: hypothetical protein EON81_11295 [bacterium]